MAATPATARAIDYQSEINNLQNDISSLNGPLQDTIAQAGTLEQAVAQLNNQIADLQNRIAANQQTRANLTVSIDKAQADIKIRTETLGKTIKSMYVDSDVTDLEKVASSSSISEFIDKQEYRNKIRDRVQTAMKQIQELKVQLEGQKTQIDQLIKDDETLRGQIALQQAAQAQLLVQTRGQEAEYQKQIASKRNQINDLLVAQAAANRNIGGGANVTAGDPAKGGYPAALNNAPKDSLVDPWGMYNRECVSYVAWKVQQKIGRMPYWGGRGNANQWPSSARADGIAVGSTPRAGAVAISMAGYYGHAMWVENVLPGGMIHVSQYNYEVQGLYSEMTISGNGLIYIYFQ